MFLFPRIRHHIRGNPPVGSQSLKRDDMNVIAIIILVALLGEFVLHLTADMLNLRALREELPESFQGFYDADRYRQSQRYLRINTRFGWLCAVVNLVLVLMAWFLKGFPLLDQWVRNLHMGSIMNGLIYIGILVLAKAILQLPFSLYSTFVIEEHFGFNKTTWGTYALDLIKAALLSIVLGGILLSGVLAFFEYTGSNAWWYCWMGVTAFMLLVHYIAPAWILPLFNKFEALEDGELKDAIFNYARSIDFPLKNVMVMDGSRRSGKSNAFFTGFGSYKRIVLFDTLIERHSISELVAVLAHEMGHYKKKHILQQMLIGIAHTGIMFFLLSVFISHKGLFDAFFMQSASVYSGIIFFGMLYNPVEFFMGLLFQILSRKNEYEADKFAVETTGDPKPMADALKKLSVHNLSNLLPHRFYVFLNYSHPPVLDRIRAIS